jgi:hypothetical protein
MPEYHQFAFQLGGVMIEMFGGVFENSTNINP